MTPVSYLMGIETVKEAVEHPLTGNFIRETIYEEIIPNIDLSREELVEFAETTLQRFKNPYIEHYFLKISVNSISKFTTRVLPTLIKHYHRTQKLPERIVFSFACLLLFYRAQRNGQSFELRDDENVISFFKANWESVDNGMISLNELITMTLRNTGFWQQDLSRIQGLESKISEYIMSIKKNGIAQTLENISSL
jgi:tagaturonate reductase